MISHTDILEAPKKFTVARQLLRSGAGIGANVREAQNAESKVDSVHKPLPTPSQSLCD